MPKLKKRKTDLIQEEIEDIEKVLRTTSPDDESYDNLVSKLERLYALRDKKHKSVKVDSNTLAVIVGGLLEIGMIMSYENLHVISTKAFSRIIRPIKSSDG